MVTGRRKPRFPVSWPLLYRCVGDQRWHPARTTNMSISGVLFGTETRPSLNSTVELRIWMEPPGVQPTLLSTGGRVVRFESSVRGGVAVEFDKQPSLRGSRASRAA
jgi:hypothetical protein